MDIEAPEARSGPSPARLVLLAGLVALAGVAALATLHLLEIRTPAEAFERLRAAFEWVSGMPAPIYFGIMAIVTLVPVPISAFYIAAGPLFGIPAALAWIAVALTANMWLAHVATSGWLRPPIVSFLEARGFRVPAPSRDGDEMALIAIVRITPGLPYFAQNWLLGLAGVDRLRYLLLSVPIQMVFAVGFVVLGSAAMNGELGLVLGGVGLIVAAGLASRVLYRRFASEAESPTST